MPLKYNLKHVKENDDNRLNGVMTVRSAIINCETNYNCSGFTYHGTVWDLDDQYEIYFYRFKIHSESKVGLNPDFQVHPWYPQHGFDQLRLEHLHCGPEVCSLSKHQDWYRHFRFQFVSRNGGWQCHTDQASK